MVGGDRSAYECVEPVLLAIGPKVMYIGGSGLAIGGGSAELGRSTTSWGDDGGRPKTLRLNTVVCAFDSDNGRADIRPEH